MLRESALEFLQTKEAKGGETVQFGWFIFKTVAVDGKLELETLDFKALSSFTRDFSIAERVNCAQQETLRHHGEADCACTLRESALVSRSYSPMSSNAFIERREKAHGQDSGWYVGMFDESLNMEDVSSFERRSLYELSINDERFVRFWLLPTGYRIYFFDAEPAVEKVEPGTAPNGGPSTSVENSEVMDGPPSVT